MIPPAPHNSTTLVLRRAFTASRQRVFRAWIEPEALEYWLRPRGMGVTVSKLEARVGGSFRFDLEGRESSLDFQARPSAMGRDQRHLATHACPQRDQATLHS